MIRETTATLSSRFSVSTIHLKRTHTEQIRGLALSPALSLTHSLCFTFQTTVWGWWCDESFWGGWGSGALCLLWSRHCQLTQRAAPPCTQVRQVRQRWVMSKLILRIIKNKKGKKKKHFFSLGQPYQTAGNLSTTECNPNPSNKEQKRTLSHKFSIAWPILSFFWGGEFSFFCLLGLFFSFVMAAEGRDSNMWYSM